MGDEVKSEGVTLPVEREEFARAVAGALRQLYDFAALGKHPLGLLLGGPELDAPARAQLLRRLLLDNIRALRPSGETPTDAPDWRGYRILQMRYIEGLSPDEAMERLALQKTQYYHDQARALEGLVGRLWELYRRTAAAAPAPTAGLLHAETERLYAQATWEEIALAPLLDELRRVLEPLAATHGATLYLRPSPSLILPRASRVLLRQAILQAVSYGLASCPAGSLEIAGLGEGGQVGLTIRAWSGAAYVAPEDEAGQAARRETCARLMAALGGQLVLRTEGGVWEARLIWEAAPPPVLLVIDDNQGFAELYRRYLAGQPWQVLGAANGAEVQAILRDTRPAVILLDVLMPQEDGWELLISLRADPATREIPIIVCSVLREVSIALALGATAYLPKPVTEAALLEALAPFRR